MQSESSSGFDRKRATDFVSGREQRSRSPLGAILLRLYTVNRLRPVIWKMALRLEGGDIWSHTARAILRRYHQIEVGLYSYGPCLRPGGVPQGTRVGNYCSLGPGISLFRRNHPADRVSLHPFFYNARCGLLERDSIRSDLDNPLAVGHDVWIGASTVVLPRCTSIGNGAIVGAGSVVTKNVEPFTVVAGNPARILRKRFSEDTERLITASRWWDLPVAELIDQLPHFLASLTPVVAEDLSQTLNLRVLRQARSSSVQPR